MVAIPDHSNKRPIRSFVRREGRLTPGQERALQELWPRYGIDIDKKSGQLDFHSLFGNDHPVIMEIGFGNGELLADTAALYPEKNFLGIEVHRPGVGHLLLKLEQRSIPNVRIISHDAIEVLYHLVPKQSLEEIWLFFPDPWPKKKHHKRRIVSPAFCDLASQLLIHDGHLHLATDWQDYAEHMQTIISQDHRFIAEKSPSGAHLLANRPLTKFEHRGKRKGHIITDLVYRLAIPAVHVN